MDNGDGAQPDNKRRKIEGSNGVPYNWYTLIIFVVSFFTT